MMRDFTEFKEETNKVYSKSAKQYKEEALAGTARVDQVELSLRTALTELEVFRNTFADFTQQREEMYVSLSDMSKSVIELRVTKHDESAANERLATLTR